MPVSPFQCCTFADFHTLFHFWLVIMFKPPVEFLYLFKSRFRLASLAFGFIGFSAGPRGAGLFRVGPDGLGAIGNCLVVVALEQIGVRPRM